MCKGKGKGKHTTGNATRVAETATIPVTAHHPTPWQMLCAMVVGAKDITRMHARPPTPTSKAEAKDAEETMAAKDLAATATKADGAAKVMAERKTKREKKASAKGTRAGCMSSI